MTVIGLTIPELRHADYIGIDRHYRAVTAGRTPTYGAPVDDVMAHIWGARGEAVIAKATGTYWSGDRGTTDRGAPDVGCWHVRTRSRPDWDLMLHRGEPPDGQFVLVVPLHLPRFRIVGWCYGHEALDERYWSDPSRNNRWAYFKPQAELRPFDQHLAGTSSLTA